MVFTAKIAGLHCWALAIYAGRTSHRRTELAESSDTSEEKQLDPTERRLERAREEGQFAQSRDLTTFLILVLFAGCLIGLGGSLMKGLVLLVQQGLTFDNSQDWQEHLAEWASGPLMNTLMWVMAIVIPLWLASAIAPLAMVKFQPVWAFKLNLARLDPIEGLGRLVSSQTLTEVFKNILKVIIVFGVAVVYIVGLVGQISVLSRQDVNQALSNSLDLIKTGLLLLLLPVLVVAAVDVIIQWFNFSNRMKMSQEELKQEMKESEGSPELKNRLRQRQRQIATSRMMSAMEKADVVLANPDHYSVALRYDAEKMRAPIVVAKGMDEIALMIQRVANENQVPVARIPPLARLLHRHLKVGEPIPAPLFEVVAKVLAWAYEIKQAAASDELPLPEIGALPDLETKTVS
jgi:flagellar biosynthetic protein FlhB